uniref:Integrase core domain containing protein n=1 Tax=Solanum tuberosum TaxID=4113 RepID=M1CY38_SOLTU
MKELDSLCTDVAALLAPPETKPESSPTAPDDEVVMTALFGDAMPPPNYSRDVGKHPYSARTSDDVEPKRLKLSSSISPRVYPYEVCEIIYRWVSSLTRQS